MILAGSEDELRTGIESIDRGRRKLFATIGELCDKFDSAPSTAAMSGDFAALYAQVSAQFAAEERLMRAKRYAFHDAHRAEHQRLLRQIRRIAEAYEDGTCAVCGTTLRACLEACLGEHLRNADRALRTLVT